VSFLAHSTRFYLSCVSVTIRETLCNLQNRSQ